MDSPLSDPFAPTRGRRSASSRPRSPAPSAACWPPSSTSFGPRASTSSSSQASGPAPGAGSSTGLPRRRQDPGHLRLRLQQEDELGHGLSSWNGGGSAEASSGRTRIVWRSARAPAIVKRTPRQPDYLPVRRLRRPGARYSASNPVMALRSWAARAVGVRAVISFRITAYLGSCRAPRTLPVRGASSPGPRRAPAALWRCAAARDPAGDVFLQVVHVVERLALTRDPPIAEADVDSLAVRKRRDTRALLGELQPHAGAVTSVPVQPRLERGAAAAGDHPRVAAALFGLCGARDVVMRERRLLRRPVLTEDVEVVAVVHDAEDVAERVDDRRGDEPGATLPNAVELPGPERAQPL